jgi:hypothetical protein
MRRLLTSSLAFIVCFGGAVLAAQRSGPNVRRTNGELLGKIDLAKSCADRHGDRSVAVLVHPTAYGWRCASRPNGIFLTSEINFDEACHEQFEKLTFARSWDEAWPYSWECFYGRRP